MNETVEQTIEQLKKDFSITYLVEETANGKVCLSISSSWRGKTNGVDSVRVYLSGLDSLTGEPIPENKISDKFSAINTSYQSGTLDYCGEYQLHYDALLENGDTVRDFKEPTTVTLTGSSRPQISYVSIQAPKGWTGYSFESNCWKRCSGKIWAKYNGRFQRLPDFHGRTMEAYFPVAHAVIEFHCSDSSLPKPQMKK